MKRKALFVGVNEYKDTQIRNLKYAVGDAFAVGTLFEEMGYTTEILENPQKMEVRIALEKITSDLKPGDFFLFYFAGHGFTSEGKHLLFCTDDRLEDLRVGWAGLPFTLLEMQTKKGGYGRAFVLDACQSDFFTGLRGSDTAARDLVPIASLVPKAEAGAGAFAVLRSCSISEHSLEIASRRHGLFTLLFSPLRHPNFICPSA